MARNNKNNSMRKELSEIDKINQSLTQLLGGETSAMMGLDVSGHDIANMHNAYHEIISSDKDNILHSKSNDVSTYGFLANAITGTNYGYNNSQLITGDPNRDKWLNKSRLEKAFTSGDTQMMSYFLSTNSDIIHIYDEIDSICAYIYQLEEAIDVIRDNILSSDSPGALVNYEVEFPGVSADESAGYKDLVKEAFKYKNIDKKLSTLVIPKLIRYGMYYFMVIPYSEIGPKMNEMRRTSGAVFESTVIDDDIMPDIRKLYEFIEFGQGDEEQHNKPSNRNSNPNKLPKHLEDKLENIKHNLSLFEIDEDERGIPNPVDEPILENFDNLSEKVKQAAKSVLKNLSNGKAKSQSSNNTTDGVVDPKDFDQLHGCYINVCDPRRLRPIKIFDYTVGYYYLENYDYAEMGTSITDLLSNQMNFNEQNLVIDNIVNSVLTKLTYGEVLKGDQQFRTMILNCLLYAERRNSPVRIKFIAPEYVVPFTTNEDEYGNGQPVLLRSLFYGRLYTSLLLFNITAIITKSTDTEFYWLKEGGLDKQYSNQVSELIDQMRASNVDPIAIANGDILRGNSAINKRYYMNAGISGERPFDMEVVSGQQVDIHNDLLTDLRKMTIGATGVPSAMIDLLDEVEYATQLTMSNIKNLKRCNTIQGDIDPSLTELAKTIIKYNYPNSIPETVLDSMKITLKRSKIAEGNITNQQIGDAQSTATTMVETWLANNDTNPPETNSFVKSQMIKELTMELTSSAPWDLMNGIYERAIINAKEQELHQKVQSGEGGNSESM